MKTPIQKFIASVDDKYLDKIQELAKQLKAKGATIEGVYEITGMITGSIPADMSLDQLKIAGIASIDKSRSVKKK